MTTIDYIVLVVYFLAMAGIGLWCMKKVKHQEDLFLGGRTFGKLFQTFAAFGAGTGAHDPVNVGRNTYTSGFSGIWSVLFWLLVTPFYWISAVWYRRMRHLTLGDWFAERYESRGLGAAYAVFGIIFYMLFLSVAFTAVSKVCEPLIFPEAAGNSSSRYYLLPTIGLVVIVYGALGGLRAAYWTDLIQGFFIILLSVLLIPFGLSLLVENFGDPKSEGLMAGFRILHEQLPASSFELHGGEFPLYYIFCIFILNLTGIVVQPHFIATGGGSAKSEHSARVGLVVGNFLKRFCTVGWALTGLIMLALLSVYPEIGKDPDQIWGHAAVKLLGPAGIGLVGLMVACLLAALMSSADCYMLVASGLVVRNCYAAYLNRDASEKQYLLIGRIVGGLVIAGAICLSLSNYRVFAQLKNAWEITVVFAAPFWVGMFWRRATRKGAWITVIFSSFVFFVLPIALPALFPGMRDHQGFSKMTPEVQRTVVRLASPTDVARRDLAIKLYDEVEATRRTGERPGTLKVGEEFSVTKRVPAGSVFWRGGVKPVAPSSQADYDAPEDRDAARAAQLKPLQDKLLAAQSGLKTAKKAFKENSTPENEKSFTEAAEELGQAEGAWQEALMVIVGVEKGDDGSRIVYSRYEEGTRLRGSGFFNFDFLFYGAIGVDLGNLSKEMKEALRVPLKVTLPFLVMIFASLLTRPNRKEALDRFYVKMKTPTEPIPEEDLKALELSYADPQRFDHKKLFPGSSFEFQRPGKADIVGFLISCLGVVGVILLALWVASIGS